MSNARTAHNGQADKYGMRESFEVPVSTGGDDRRFACSKLRGLRSAETGTPNGLALYVILLFALGLRAFAAEPVTFFLKNGDRVTGTIVSEETNRVVIATPWAKEVVIPAVQISRREISKSAPPAVPGAGATAGMTPPSPPKKPSHFWTGEANIGTDLGFSQIQRQLYTGRAKVLFAYERLKNLFEYDVAYGRSDGILSANRMDGSSKTEFDLGHRYYVYHIGGAGYDEIRKIAVRYELGPGTGYHLIQRTNFMLNTEVGANYQEQRFSNDDATHLFYYRLAEMANWPLSAKLTMDEKLEFFPRVEDVEEYRFRFESNVRLWLRANLSLNLTVIDLYDTQPAPNVTRNDLQVRSSLGVKF